MIWDAKLHTVSEKLSLWIFYLILGRFRLVLERHFLALYQRYSLLFAPYISRIPNVPKLPQNSVNGQKAPRSYGEGDERNIMWVCFCCPLVAVASIGRREKPNKNAHPHPLWGGSNGAGERSLRIYRIRDSPTLSHIVHLCDHRV